MFPVWVQISHGAVQRPLCEEYFRMVAFTNWGNKQQVINNWHELMYFIFHFKSWPLTFWWTALLRCCYSRFSQFILCVYHSPYVLSCWVERNHPVKINKHFISTFLVSFQNGNISHKILMRWSFLAYSIFFSWNTLYLEHNLILF